MRIGLICAAASLGVVLAVGLSGQRSGGASAVSAANRQQSPDAKAGVLFQVHWIGRERLSSSTTSNRWVEVWALPESRVLENQALEKLSRTPFRLLAGRIPANAKDHAELLRPLLDDLLQAECWAEARQGQDGGLQVALAVKLGEDRARLWNTNLATVMASWTGSRAMPVSGDRYAGWKLEKARPPKVIQCLRAGSWVVLGCGDQDLSLQSEFLARIRDKGAPGTLADGVCLSAVVDWVGLGRHVPLGSATNWPRLELALTSAGENVRTRIEASFAKPLDFEFREWNVPTNIIHEPLSSFTASQGWTRKLTELEVAKALKLSDVPNQFYVWALSASPFQTFVAAPMADPTNTIRQVGPSVLERFNPQLPRYSAGTVRMTTNPPTLIWQGLPYVVPFLQPARDAGRPFLFAGLFPNNTRTNLLPQALLGQVIGRTNLVYYDWEITQERLLHWRNLMDLCQIVFKERRVSTNPPCVKWLNAVGPRLGNTATEVTRTGPNRLTLARQSPLGLTGFEIMLLLDWLESPDFPLRSHTPAAARHPPAAARQNAGFPAPARR